METENCELHHAKTRRREGTALADSPARRVHPLLRAFATSRAAVAVLALLATAGIGAPLHAQPTRSPLDALVAEALANNLGLAQQTVATQRAAAAVREANGRFLPSATVNARRSEFSGVVNIGDFINPAYAALNQLIGQSRFPTDVNATLPFKQETKLDVTLPLYNDALFAARDAARAQRDLTGSARRTAMRQLAADIQLAWLGYATASRAVETLEATLPVLDENQRVSERLIGAGQATPDVLLRARAERSDVGQQLADAQRQRDAARRTVNLLRNRDDDTPLPPATTTGADSLLATSDSLAALTLDALIAHALTHRDELAQASAGTRMADAQTRAVRASFKPTVALATSYGVQGADYQFDRDHDVALASLVLSWNVFNGGQDAARREQALATRSEADYRRREIERAVRLQVANAHDALRTARTTLGVAADRLAAAERAFTLVQRRYAEGLATQVEFLSARSAFTAAALNQVVTRYSVAARAVDLERAAALRALPN
ncbi:MAG: TolC family protein [Gemmatimonadetes bacterium]|nr:TolC family protein [Gemmatimonadota bacterium]